MKVLGGGCVEQRTLHVGRACQEFPCCLSGTQGKTGSLARFNLTANQNTDEPGTLHYQSSDRLVVLHS